MLGQFERVWDMKPIVSIGVPVYNGQPYLSETLDSLLSQTFEDFELIIADNASNDGSEEICRAYAARDQRIRYLRSDTNWGAAWSHNVVFQLARGRYFKWAAADDLCAPTFLARCLEVLGADPATVLVLPGVIEIDEEGQEIGRWEHGLRVGHPSPHVRFHEFACVWNDCLHFFGLIRASVLRRTGLVGSFIESDNVTLSELALHGPFFDHPEPLFLHRNHPGQSIRAMESRYERAAWFDPRMSKRLVFPEWRLGREHLRVVGRAPLCRQERLRCYTQILPWLWWRKGSLVEDFRWARHTAKPIQPGRFAAVENPS